MKTGILINLALLLSMFVGGQNAKVIIIKHELRWTDEIRFPNYFLDPEIRDSVFSDTRRELMKALQVGDVIFPEKVEYKIINGFGNQKVEMPETESGKDPEIGIFSFITRGTSNFAIYWKLTLQVRIAGKIRLSKQVSHELEYYDASGYFTSRRWLSPEDFRSIFGRMVKEALSESPSPEEKIILDTPEEKEQLVRTFFPFSERALLKIKGAWRNTGNFAALLEAGNDTLATIDYRSGWESEYVKPTGSAIFAGLFTAVTGIDMTYEQKVIREKKGTMRFPNGRKTKVRLKWIEMQERTVKNNEGTMRIAQPVVTELYDGEKQTGNFLYTSREEVHTTPQTKEKFNIYTGFQPINTLGSEQTYRIEGYLGDIPVFAELNEFHGIIEVAVDSVLTAMMVVQNVNPENRTFGNAKLTRNKRMAFTGVTIGKQSLDKTEKVEWYPVYLPAGASAETGEMCLKILTCLFFGIGNPASSFESSE